MRDESLAFILADACYDVWLFNSRGNRYSPANSWAWQWDQHASIDLPTSVTYVLKTAGISRLSALIAHSQGGTIMLAALSKGWLSVNSSLAYIALAPVTFMAHQKSLLLSTFVKLGGAKILKVLGDHPFSPSPSLLKSLLGVVGDLTPGLCTDISGSLFGTPLPQNVNSSRVSVYADSWPDQTSVRNMIHWLQNTNSGDFQDYNGVEYNVTKIPQTRMTIFCGGEDKLGDLTDCQTLVAKLNTVPNFIEVSDFSHMDFTWSFNAATKVYESILELLPEEYN